MKLRFLILLFCVVRVFALGLADFVPGFLEESQSVKTKQDHLRQNTKFYQSSKEKSWYCDRVQSRGEGSVFCKNNDESIISGSESDNGNNPTTSLRQSALSTSSNQYTLQSQSTRNVFNNQNNFSVPIKPSQDVNFSVGQQQVEVNIKY